MFSGCLFQNELGILHTSLESTARNLERNSLKTVVLEFNIKVLLKFPGDNM